MPLVHTSRYSRRRLAAVGVALSAALAVPCVATPASAAAASVPATADGDTTDRDSADRDRAERDRLGDRVRHLCERVPKLIRRAQNLLDHILGGADVVGSLAWLDVQIERAKAAGQRDLVIVLTNRREIRAALVPVLERYIARLTEILARCQQLRDSL